MISEQDKKRAERICIHEAGHLIVSKQNGFKTNGISILVNQRVGHSGETTIILPVENITDNDRLIDYLEKRIQILYAGVIAEYTDINKNYDQDLALNDWRTGGGMIDHAKVRELTHVLRNISHPNTFEEQKQQEELTKLDEDNFEKAAEIVMDKIELIHKIGNLLADKILFYDTNYNLPETEIEQHIDF